MSKAIAVLIGMLFTVPFEGNAQTLPDSPGVVVASYPEVLHRMPILRPAGVTALGVVQVDVTLDAQGAVTDARVVIGPEQLRKTVLANLLEWHFAAGSSSARVNVTFGDPKADGSMPARPGAPILDPLPVPPPVRPPYVFSRILFGGLSSELEQRVRAKLGFKEDQSVNKTLAEITATVQKVDPHLTVGIAATPTELSTNPRVSLTLRINLPVTAAIVVGPGYAGGGSSRPSMSVPSGTLQVGIDQLRIQNKVPPAYTKQVKEAGGAGFGEAGSTDRGRWKGRGSIAARSSAAAAGGDGCGAPMGV